MTIAITTPTGNVGHEVSARLLDASVPVRLLVRDAARVEDLVGRGAEVAVGSLDDADYVETATRDVEQLFWVTPSDLSAADLRARQVEFGEVARRAVERNRIGRVVNLSSVGAQLAEGNGPIGGLHDNESLLEGVAHDLLHLRPAYFMENLLALAPMIATQHVLALPMPSSTRMPMVATRDIAAVAAAELMDAGWSGHRVRGVHGPADLSWDEVAGVADSYVEMLEGLGSGRVRAAEARDDSTTTPTTLETFVSDTLYPAVESLAS
jgi:uncharacterized protein YbjT (DUF2867 family)